MKDEDFEWDEFGNDLYAIPETLPVLSSNLVQDAPPTSKEDEDMKIKALIDTPTLDWQRWEVLLWCYYNLAKVFLLVDLLGLGVVIVVVAVNLLMALVLVEVLDGAWVEEWWVAVVLVILSSHFNSLD